MHNKNDDMYRVWTTFFIEIEYLSLSSLINNFFVSNFLNMHTYSIWWLTYQICKKKALFFTSYELIKFMLS